MKLGILIKSRNALMKLYHAQGLDSITAYRIAKNAHVIEKELKIFDAQNAKVIDKYCVRGEDGKPVVKDGLVSITDMAKYEEELKMLFEEEVDVVIKTISIEAINSVGLSPAQLSSIEYMLEMEE